MALEQIVGTSAIAPRERAASYPMGTVGHLMDPPVAVYLPGTSVGQAIEVLRELIRTEFITYLYVVDAADHLLGVVAMRELLFAMPEQRLSEIMVREPFALTAGMSLLEAMRQVLGHHFPVYPVCDDDRVLVGLLRGQTMFRAEAVEISAQPGRMVGVEAEERLTTPLKRSFRLRHPWLQFNLLTAFVAAAVVGLFQATINEVVLLAAFLPVVAGQCGNTGAQALAITIRGITLGELRQDRTRQLILKEGLLGLVNGTFVGVTAAAGMLAFAAAQDSLQAWGLGLTIFLAMLTSCALSGVAGALVPLALRRLGVDPATASTILLTTVTDVLSMGIFLGLATWML